MKFIVKKSDISGTVDIPASKSHTIRALFFAALADGESKIIKPLLSEDGLSALKTIQAFGARVEKIDDYFLIQGTSGRLQVPDNVIDVGNSGTTMNVSLSIASLINGYTVLTGDAQIRNRDIAPLVTALNNIGASVITTKNNGKPPVIVKGKATGGYTKLDATSSQFLTSLLISAPLMEKDTTIDLNILNEVPYVEITLWRLDKQGIKYQNDGFKRFVIQGNQSYKSFEETIPADFSSATFFMALAAIGGGEVTLKNLDMTDKQGDKRVVSILQEMGAKVTIKPDGITVKGDSLKGIEIDMNSIPDALPALAVVGCFAEGETRLLNVAQARNKETDRIRVMREELTKMGADIEELEDGLVIRKSKLKPATVDGRSDHRVVMALAVAGLCIDGTTTIDSAEAASVTFPNFAELITKIGGDISVN